MRKSFSFIQPNLRRGGEVERGTLRWEWKPLVEWNLRNFVAGKLSIAEWKLAKEFYELRECYGKSDERKMFLYLFLLILIRLLSLDRLKSIKVCFCLNDFVVCSFTDHVDSHIVRIDFGHFVWHLSLLNKHREPTGEKAFSPLNMAFADTNNFTKPNKHNFSLWLFQLLNARHFGGELTSLWA